MPVIKVADIAYGRLSAPDLDVQEEFLTQFGMVRAARTATALYMRGTDPQHHLHVTELGPSRFIGFAFHAASEEDLARLARVDGASGIEPIDEPGGGRCVRLRDPHGYQIEVVHGLDPVEALPVQWTPVNLGTDRLRRAGTVMRLARRPAQVKRMGHGVLMTPDLRRTLGWYREMLGFLCSDDVYAGEPGNVVASFNRCDRGETYVDHHVFFAFQGERAGLNHFSYEVHDLDDLMIGHEHLRRAGKYRHMWGIGRHTLGSQIFDYWADPWNRMHEHWTDTDVLNAANGSGLVAAAEGLSSQWGAQAPVEFTTHATP